MYLANNNEINKISSIKKRNLGIELLRMFLCFRIVLLHYYSSNNPYILKLKRNRFQVPCFFFISFYFLFPIFSERKYQKLKLRLERLLIPYIIHPILNWIINNIMFLVIKFNRYNRFLTLRDIKTQIMVGRGIYGVGVLWFHFNLLILTVFYFITSNFFKDYFLLIFQISALFSYAYQYSEINLRFFLMYSENISLTIGNLLETFPISIFAFSIAYIKIYRIMLKNRGKWILFSISFLYLVRNYNIFQKIRGFSSPGVEKNFVSFFLFATFSLMPLEILNSKILLLIMQITNYTQGIYCLHFLLQYYLKLKFDKKGTLIGCIFLYIFSYFISFIGFKICYKTKLKFLFS